MLLRCAARSVGRGACAWKNGIATADVSSIFSVKSESRNGIWPTTMHTFEERVFHPTGLTRTISTLDYEKLQHNKIQHDNANESNSCEEYEQAIKALNKLQSNADSIRRSVVQPTSLVETRKYLEKSGMSLEDLGKLSIIHVSGTKGKGSTCALTESILRAHGAKTGFFSSPHLVSVTERIRINGVPIGKADFTRHFWRIYKRLQSQQTDAHDMPAYFKFLTILCFHIFLEQKVDVVILEVGIGGELDSTNIVRNTKICGITSLGLEHTQVLGETLAEIAWQKAGIIKSHANVYTSVNQPECLAVIRQRAAEKNATVHIVPELTAYNKSSNFLASLNNVIKLNCSLAIQLSYDWLLQHKNGLHRNYALNAMQVPEKVLMALRDCNWPGRCQVVKYFNFNIHLDGAHTIDSMHVCSDWFEQIAGNSNNPKILIFNTTGDRDSRQLLEILRHKNYFSLACFVPNIAFGSANKDDIQSVFGLTEQLERAQLHAGHWHMLCEESAEQDSSHTFDSILDALNCVQERYGLLQEVDVLVTGSLHLIGAAVLALNNLNRFVSQT